MAVTLLKMDDGTTSLEFEREDWPAVRNAIAERYGEIEVRKCRTTDFICFGGQSFSLPILEWEPTLFADTAEGAAMLADIATVFGKDGMWVPTPVYFGPPYPSTKQRFSKIIIGAVLALAAIALAMT